MGRTAICLQHRVRTVPLLALYAGLALGCAALAGPAAGAAPLLFTGMCDASAAVALDDTHFAVADDERDTLRVYDVATLQQTFEINLTDYLQNRNNDGDPKEADLEGATRRGANVIWISSHGRNKEGKQKVFRWRLFETPILAGTPPTLGIPITRAYAGLHADLLAFGEKHPELGFAQAEPNPPKKGGLNIEGLADAGDDDLFIGFRSPLVGGKAIVLKLLDVSTVLSGGQGPIAIEETKPLDLGQRGIRSMEKVGDRYLIVGGPSTGDDSSEGAKVGFALFSWDGKSPEVARIDFDFSGLSPEALFEIGTPSHLMALSDDGTVQVGGLDCKENDTTKRFRAIAIDLP